MSPSLRYLLIRTTSYHDLFVAPSSPGNEQRSLIIHPGFTRGPQQAKFRISQVNGPTYPSILTSSFD